MTWKFAARQNGRSQTKTKTAVALQSQVKSKKNEGRNCASISIHRIKAGRISCAAAPRIRFQRSKSRGHVALKIRLQSPNLKSAIAPPKTQIERRSFASIPIPKMKIYQDGRVQLCLRFDSHDQNRRTQLRLYLDSEHQNRRAQFASKSTTKTKMEGRNSASVSTSKIEIEGHSCAIISIPRTKPEGRSCAPASTPKIKIETRSFASISIPKTKIEGRNCASTPTSEGRGAYSRGVRCHCTYTFNYHLILSYS